MVGVVLEMCSSSARMGRRPFSGEKTGQGALVGSGETC